MEVERLKISRARRGSCWEEMSLWIWDGDGDGGGSGVWRGGDFMGFGAGNYGSCFLLVVFGIENIDGG